MRIKATFVTVAATVCLLATASGAPRVLLDTTATDLAKPKSPSLIGQFHSTTSVGKETVTRIGEYDYAVTPMLRGNGSVDLSVAVTHYFNDQKTHTFGPFRHHVTSRQPFEIAVGATYFTTRVTIAK